MSTDLDVDIGFAADVFLKQQLKWKRIWQKICERMVIASPVVHRAKSVQIRIEETRQKHNKGTENRARSKGCFLCMHSFSGKPTK
jgi:hypothetical protein